MLAALGSFRRGGAESHRVPPAEAIPLLCEELERGQRHGPLFAAHALRLVLPRQEDKSQMANDVMPVVERVLRQTKDDKVRWVAFLTLVDLDQKGDQIAATLREWIQAEKDALLEAALRGPIVSLLRSELLKPPRGPLPARSGPILAVFLEEAQSPRPTVRLAAVRALAELAKLDESARKAVIEAALGEDPEIARLAVSQWLRSLRSSSDQEAVPTAVLLVAIEHPEPEIRQGSLRMLLDRKPKAAEVLPQLIKVLERETNEVVIGLIFAELRRFGPEAKPALPVLRRLAESGPGANTRQMAGMAVQALAAEPPSGPKKDEPEKKE